MSDGYVMTTDPGIGPKGLRDDVAAMVKANVRQILIDALADKLGHAYAVASGKTHFREAFVREMGAFWGNSRAGADNLADVCYQFLDKAWADQYPGESAFAFLDNVHVPSQESQAEIERQIEDSWQVEIASDEASMAKHYHGSARVRKGRDIFSSFWQKNPSTTVQ